MHTLFQTIRGKISTDDTAAFSIVGCFLIIGITRLSIGFVPWYMVLMTVPMFLVALARPRAGVYGIIVLTILFERFFTLEGFQFGRDIVKLYPLDVVLFGVYGGVLAEIFFRKTNFAMRRVDTLFLSFFSLVSLYFLASFIHWDNQEISVAFSTWKNYVFYGLLFFVIPRVFQDERSLKRLVGYFLSAAAVGILFLCIGVVRGNGLWTEYTPLSTEGVRFLAFPHAFYFSLAFLGMIVSAQYWFRHPKRIFLWGVMTLWTIGIVASLMRHIWVGLAITICASFLFLMDWMGRRVVVNLGIAYTSLTVMIFSGILFVSLLFPTHQMSRSFQSLGQSVVGRVTSISDTTDESISWRGSTWQSAFGVLEKNPVFGSGFGMHVAVESGTYHDFIEVRNIHNSWLALLVQMGLLGFGLFLMAGLALMVSLYRTPLLSSFLSALRNGLFAVIVYFGIVFLAQPYLETNLMSIFFWMSLGVMRSLMQMRKSGIIS